MCSLCPRKKTPQKKIVRFDSFVDTFSISDINTSSGQKVSDFFSEILQNIFIMNYSVLARSFCTYLFTKGILKSL